MSDLTELFNSFTVFDKETLSNIQVGQRYGLMDNQGRVWEALRTRTHITLACLESNQLYFFQTSEVY